MSDDKEAKKKTGRPPRVLTEKEIHQVESLAAVLSIDQMADYLSISQKTFQQILKRQDGVSTAYKKGRSNAIGSVAKGLIRKAMDGDTTSAIFYLKTQAGWKETQHIQQETKKTKKFSDLYGNTEPESN